MSSALLACVAVLMLRAVAAEPETAPSSDTSDAARVVEPQLGAPLAASISQTGYALGAGDVISLDDATMGSLVSNGKLLDDGSLVLPLVGRVFLGGSSVAQAKQVLSEKYAKYYVNPKLTLKIVSQHPLRVYIRGAVANPGVYVSGKNMSPDNHGPRSIGNEEGRSWHYRLYLADALMMAGGLAYNANARDVIIHRSYPQPETLHVNLLDLFSEGNVLQDVDLRDQDVVEVAELPDNALVMDNQWETFARNNVTRGVFKVSVLGAVKSPGALQMKSQDTVLTAIAKAGGFSDFADKSRVYVLRTTTTGQVVKRELNMRDRAMIGKKPFHTWAALMPNDIVFVDESSPKKTASFVGNFANRASNAAIFPFFNNLFNK